MAQHFRSIVIIFNDQGEQTKLLVNGNPFNENEGKGALSHEDHKHVLWGGVDRLELVEGSVCVVIDGRRYCA